MRGMAESSPVEEMALVAFMPVLVPFGRGHGRREGGLWQARLHVPSCASGSSARPRLS